VLDSNRDNFHFDWLEGETP